MTPELHTALLVCALVVGPVFLVFGVLSVLADTLQRIFRND
jgi:hypothetical protein